MVNKVKVETSNLELYNKLNALIFTNEVVVKNVSKRVLSKVLNNINRYENRIELEKIGEYYILRKKLPFDCYINLRK